MIILQRMYKIVMIFQYTKLEYVSPWYLGICITDICSTVFKLSSLLYSIILYYKADRIIVVRSKSNLYLYLFCYTQLSLLEDICKDPKLSTCSIETQLFELFLPVSGR